MHPLERLRKERGLPRRAVAERVGVALQTVYAWEREGKRPSLAHLRRLAEVLDASPAEVSEIVGIGPTPAGKA